MRSMDRFEEPGEEEHRINWGRSYLDQEEYLRDQTTLLQRMAIREGALLRAEQVIAKGETPDLDALVRDLENEVPNE
ncbi:hypothetical protein LCGC14_2506680 [marine sediment metagenome]|uniref:Uncharacterized protein n=1 Tax=marine sediment metagenome TaxID=412755 RepID=A0A0F9DTZ1_9ZZZZ